MKVFEQLHTASFEKFEFLVASETSDSGKKIVSHEYPNSNKRFSEELGEIPPKFTIDAIIHGDLNYRLRFEQILRKKGLGTLVHPIYGTIKVMATTYSVSSNQTDIGEFRFTISFEVSEANIAPKVEVPGESNVTVKKNTAQSNTLNALSNNYTPPDTKDGVSSIRTRLDSWLEELDNGINKIVSPIQQNVNSLTRKISDSRRNIITVVQNAETLRTTLEDLYLSVSNCVNTPADLVDYWDRLISFSFIPSYLSRHNVSMDLDGESVVPDSAELKDDTYKRDNILKNRRSLDDSIAYAALINMIEALSYQQARTDRELAIIRQRLNSLFKSMVKDMPSLQDAIGRQSEIATDNLTRGSMYDLKNAADKLLNQRETNIWNTSDTSVKGFSSLALVTYQQLGDLENMDLIEALNPGLSGYGFGPTDIRTIR